MIKPSIAITIISILPVFSVASAADMKSNTSNQVSRQTANYAGLEQVEFEAQLREQFAGTYAIYNGLPLGTRSEIYQTAANGKEISSLRSMIVDRARNR